MIKIKFFLKKYWLFLILSLIIGSLIGIYLINKNQGQKVKSLLSIPSQKIESYPVKAHFNINLLEENIKNIDHELDVYEISNIPFSNEEALKIANIFNLNNQPKVYTDQRTNNIFYEWLTEDKFLTINLSNRTINFELITPNLEKNNQLSDLNVFETLSQNLLKENQLYPQEPINLDLKNKNYLKINKTLYQETNSLIEANGVIIKYQYQISNKKIVGAEISLVFNSNKELIKFNYQPPPKLIKFISLYPLKNKTEIIKELENIKAINFFDIPNYYATYSEIKNLNKIDLNKIEIVYIKNELSQGYLQPFFLISGEGVLNDGRTAEVGLYLPAIKDEYLLK